MDSIVIEGFNHAVFISCSDQERLTRLCSVTGYPFILMKKGQRMDKVREKYKQVSCWKPEKILTEPTPVNHILELRERKLLSGEKVSIPAGSAKLVKVIEETEIGERRG